MSDSSVAGAQTAISPFEAFRRAVMADAALQAELSQLYDPAAFVALALSLASERGLTLSADDIWAHLQPDPLDLSRWFGNVELASEWAPSGWLPTAIGFSPEPYLDWAHFADVRLTHPFYEDSLRSVRSRPFNLAFRRRTRLPDLIAGGAPGGEATRPAGLIFHLSRCGSTLAAQMLAAVPGYVVVSEAAPIDTAAQLESADPSAYAGLLPAVVGAVGRRRFEGDRRLFIKLDSWHVACLPLFRRAF